MYIEVYKYIEIHTHTHTEIYKYIYVPIYNQHIHTYVCWQMRIYFFRQNCCKSTTK